jgi:hypothetical protein
MTYQEHIERGGSWLASMILGTLTIVLAAVLYSYGGWALIGIWLFVCWIITILAVIYHAHEAIQIERIGRK